MYHCWHSTHTVLSHLTAPVPLALSEKPSRYRLAYLTVIKDAVADVSSSRAGNLVLYRAAYWLKIQSSPNSPSGRAVSPLMVGLYVVTAGNMS
jgi:hypothetical protein